MKITDWIQAISAAAVAILTLFLWRLARRQTQLLDTSVRVAQQSAEAASKSAEVAERTLVGVQRPFLGVRLTPLEITPRREGDRFDEYRVMASIENNGREAAIIVDSAVQFVPYHPSDEVPKPGVRPFDLVWSATDLAPGVVVHPDRVVGFAITRLMAPSDVEKIENSGGIPGCLFVYGTIVYEDPLGIRRELGFTYGWDQGDKSWFRCAFEGHNYDRVIDANANPVVFEPLATRDDAL